MVKPFQYVTSHPGQLSLAIPLWVAAVKAVAYTGTLRDASEG